VEEEERRNKGKGRVEEEEFEAGRILALIKKRDPALYEEVMAIARSEGLKPSELVEEAVAMYRDYKFLIGVDPKCLTYSLRILQLLMQRTVEIITFVHQYFTVQQASLAEAIAERIKSEVGEAKEREGSRVPSEVRERLVTVVSDMVLRMLQTLMGGMVSTTARAQQAQVPSTSAEGRKPKIVVGSGKGKGEGKAGESGT